MSREDQYDVSVTLIDPANGTRHKLDRFDKMAGGAVESETTSYREGGMSTKRSLGGTSSTSNVTAQRLYKHSRDHVLMPMLWSAAGKWGMEVVKQPLDINGVIFGSPITYKGTLINVSAPDVDSESTDAALLELEMEVDGLPS